METDALPTQELVRPTYGGKEVEFKSCHHHGHVRPLSTSDEVSRPTWIRK